MQFEPIEQWIWIPDTLCPDRQTTLHTSMYGDAKKDGNYTVARFEKSFRFDKPISSVHIRTSGDTFCRLSVNGGYRITGPASVTDQIEKAVIKVDLSDQRGSISQDYRYTLCDAEGNAVDAEKIVTNVAEVHLDMTIQMVKELPLRLEVLYNGGATAENTTISIDPPTIRLAGGEAVLESLGDSITLGKIDLSLIDRSQTLTFPITLPEGVTNLSNVAEAAAAIRFVGLSTREFTVDSIHIINIPEGMTADVITEKLTVVLRGSSADLAGVKPEDITATVDFAGAEAGTSTFKVTISCSEDIPGVGAVGTYSVSAIVQQK